MSEDIIKSIDELLDAGIGDKGRLEHIKSSLLKGKTIYNSDKSYLNSIINEHSTKPIRGEKSENNSSNKEKSINLEELRKSQPKPKYESRPTKFGVSFSSSGKGSAKIHMVRCRHVQRSSQEGDTKWSYFSNYTDAKIFAQAKAPSQSHGWKYAGCCSNGHIGKVTVGAVILSLSLGIIGAAIGWYITKEYHPTGSKIIFSIGAIITIIWLASSVISYLR